MKKIFCLALICVAMFSLTSCISATYIGKNGYYTAEAKDFDEHGWKEFVTIFVKDGVIISAEYNAKNTSGFIKSWDMEYMRVMSRSDGTYPNEYTRLYAANLINTQNPDDIDIITGATHSHGTFVQLARAAIERANIGTQTVALVDFEPTEHE